MLYQNIPSTDARAKMITVNYLEFQNLKNALKALEQKNKSIEEENKKLRQMNSEMSKELITLREQVKNFSILSGSQRQSVTKQNAPKIPEPIDKVNKKNILNDGIKIENEVKENKSKLFESIETLKKDKFDNPTFGELPLNNTVESGVTPGWTEEQVLQVENLSDKKVEIETAFIILQEQNRISLEDITSYENSIKSSKKVLEVINRQIGIFQEQINVNKSIYGKIDNIEEMTNEVDNLQKKLDNMKKIIDESKNLLTTKIEESQEYMQNLLNLMNIKDTKTYYFCDESIKNLEKEYEQLERNSEIVKNNKINCEHLFKELEENFNKVKNILIKSNKAYKEIRSKQIGNKPKTNNTKNQEQQEILALKKKMQEYKWKADNINERLSNNERERIKLEKLKQGQTANFQKFKILKNSLKASNNAPSKLNTSIKQEQMIKEIENSQNKKIEEKQLLYNQERKSITESKKILEFEQQKILLEQANIEKKYNKKINWENIEYDDQLLNKNSMIFEYNLTTDSDRKSNPMFYSSLLFSKDNSDEKLFTSGLIKKNWSEICEIFEEHDMHDINFKVKAVGLEDNESFNSISVFPVDKNMKIIEAKINNKVVQIKYQNNYLTLDIKLANEQMVDVNIKYQKKHEKNNKICRECQYGLDQFLAGQTAKFTLRVNDNWSVVYLEDEKFVKYDKGSKDYIWGGKVPVQGYQALVKFSKPFAMWKVNCNEGLSKAKGTIDNTTVEYPILFVGGNLALINLNNYCPHSKNVEIRDDKYRIIFQNTKSSKVFFTTKGTIKNRCKGEWNVEITDDNARKLVGKDVNDNREILKKIAMDIINKDKNTLPEFIKICKWVHNNMTYDISLSGKSFPITEIYKQMKGVSLHFSLLFNGLLNSLGYLTLLVKGFRGSSLEFSDSTLHIWSLVKINGYWIPFCPSCCLYSGKLPVDHIFSNYLHNHRKVINTSDKGMQFAKVKKVVGKFVEK